jgi:hypothetical protein
MTPDNTTLIVSVPSAAQLVYYDTVANREIKKVNVDFQPTVLALQGRTLFAGARGSAIVHALDADSGKESGTINIPGPPLQALACHPAQGNLFAANTENRVFCLNPQQGTATPTTARGAQLAVDPQTGAFLYTGTPIPFRDQMEVRDGPGGSLIFTFDKKGGRATLLKYAIQDTALKLVAGNDNGAINGKGMALSPDGTRLAMAGGGGWRSKTDPKANYAIAVFGTADLQTMLGQVEVGPFPENIAFHPALDLGVAQRGGPETQLLVFQGKSLAVRQTLKAPGGFGGLDQGLLTFGGRGTKVIFSGSAGPGGGNRTLHFYPLELGDEDRAALARAYGG